MNDQPQYTLKQDITTYNYPSPMIKTNKHCGQLFGVLYNNTFNRLEYLKNKGYNVKFIWETGWKNFKRGIVSFPSIEQL